MNVELIQGITLLVQRAAEQAGVGFRTVSVDELEDIDSIRGCFMIVLDIVAADMTAKCVQRTRYEATITYFAPLENLEGLNPEDAPSVAMVQLAELLNKAFAREFKVGAHYFDIEDKDFIMDKDALDLTFRFDYRTYVEPPEEKALNYPNEESFTPDQVAVMEDIKIASTD